MPQLFGRSIDLYGEVQKDVATEIVRTNQFLLSAQEVICRFAQFLKDSGRQRFCRRPDGLIVAGLASFVNPELGDSIILVGVDAPHNVLVARVEH